MKAHWCEDRFIYDGSQLCSRFALEKFKLAGDSIVGWRGACAIPLENMVDNEDRMNNAKICGDDMLHFIVEVLNYNLLGITALQRLLAAIAKDVVIILSPEKILTADMRREGDDLWVANRKLSISVATTSPVSAMIHFAVDVTNEGTPVPTLSLEDLKIKPQDFARELLARFREEFLGLQAASEKVNAIP